MKRDMDLFRKVMRVIESDQWTVGIPLKIDGFDERTVAYHVAMLGQAGYLTVATFTMNDGFPQAIPIAMTNAGHDFIDLANSESLWSKAKSIMATGGMGCTLDILTDLLSSLAKKQLGLS